MEGPTVAGVTLLGKGVHTGALNPAFRDWEWLPRGGVIRAVSLKVKSQFAK